VLLKAKTISGAITPSALSFEAKETPLEYSDDIAKVVKSAAPPLKASVTSISYHLKAVTLP